MCANGCNNGCVDCGGLECGTGPAGLDGQNAFTVTTGTFLQPAFGDPAITINVSALGQSTGLWAGVGQWIFIVGAGFFKVVTSTTTILTVIVPSATIQTYNYTLAANGATIAIGSGVSPAGVEGAGTNGTSGVDGTSILFQNISVSSCATIGTGYTAAVFSNAPITVPANTLLTVGDMLRLDVTFQSDTELNVAGMPANTTFSAEILFGGSRVWEGFIGSGLSSNMNTGRILSIDLIVTATNTLSSRVNKVHSIYGNRTNQTAVTIGSTYYAAFATPAQDSTGASISPITPTLSNSNAIVVNLKNSTGTSTHLASVTSIVVTKYKKI